MENSLEDLKNDPDVQEAIKSLSTTRFNEICRSCLVQQDDVKPIFELTFENLEFSTLFTTCTSVQVSEDDDLPKNICDVCIQNFIQVYCFIIKCKQSNEILRLVIENEKKVKRKVKQRSKRIKTDSDPLKCEQPDEVLQSTVVSESIKSETNEISLDVNCDSKNKKRSTSCPTYMCRSCNINFSTFHELKEHRREVKHPQVTRRACPLCNKVVSRGCLAGHMRTHTKEKPYQCEFCSMRFNIRHNLNRHLKRHTGERPYTCEICGKGFIQLASLKDHMIIHTGEKYECSYCGKTFSQKQQHKIHVRKHETGSIDKCEVCNKVFASINSLKTHMKQHGDKAFEEYAQRKANFPTLQNGSDYKCEVCNKYFATKNTLNTHMLKHGEKKFLCSHCGKDFYYHSGLLSHLKVHTGARPYTCRVCNKAYSHLGNLRTHELVHKGIKPFVCEICSKAFRQSPHLTIHLRTHSGEKPYVCSYCGKSFATHGTLTVHTRIHTGETPYVCDVCEKGFHDSSSMKKHRKGHEQKSVTKS